MLSWFYLLAEFEGNAFYIVFYCGLSILNADLGQRPPRWMQVPKVAPKWPTQAAPNHQPEIFESLVGVLVHLGYPLSGAPEGLSSLYGAPKREEGTQCSSMAAICPTPCSLAKAATATALLGSRHADGPAREAPPFHISQPEG